MQPLMGELWGCHPEPWLMDMDEVTLEIFHVRVCDPGSTFLIKNMLLPVSLIHITTFFATAKRIHKFINITTERNLDTVLSRSSVLQMKQLKCKLLDSFPILCNKRQSQG